MSQTPEEIQADIERQRAELAGTVDQLASKLDVKSQAQAKATEAKVQAQQKAHEVKDKLTTNEGKPRPEALGGAAAVVVLLAGLVLLKRRRNRR